MKQNTFKPRGGAIIILCIAVAALWLTAVYGTYEDSQREKYSVTIKPGEVVYGTHSSAVVPMTVTTTRPGSTVPMVSASAVRSYAHHGHATMPAASQSSGYTMHTTSSATVHTVGSGGGASGGGATASSGASSSRGIRYGGGSVASVAMPVLAVNSSMMAAPVLATEPSMPRAIGPRRAKPDDESGDEGDWSDNGAGDNDWWYKDEDGWREPYTGETRIDPDLGYSVTWTGSTWVKSSEYDPGVPVGATPWLLMMALGAIYAVRKRVRSSGAD